jgi:hypothetical protein
MRRPVAVFEHRETRSRNGGNPCSARPPTRRTACSTIAKTAAFKPKNSRGYVRRVFVPRWRLLVRAFCERCQGKEGRR